MDSSNDPVVSAQEAVSELDGTDTKETPSVPPSHKTNSSLEEMRLPDGWVSMMHQVGRKLYFHKSTRLCTWAQPYVLPLNKKVRKHRIPQVVLSGLTQTSTGIQDTSEVQCKDDSTEIDESFDYSNNEEDMPEDNTVSTSNQESSSGDAIQRENGQVNTKWRKNKGKKDVAKDSIAIPKHIRCYHQQKTGKPLPKALLVKKGQSSLAQVYTLPFPVTVTTRTLECDTSKSSEPFVGLLCFDGIIHGSGFGSTKKHAKQEAAYMALHALFSESFPLRPKDRNIEGIDEMDSIALTSSEALTALSENHHPSPWTILEECVQRNKDVFPNKGDIALNDSSRNEQYICEMSLGGDFVAEGANNSNKLLAREEAAQKVLSLMFPYISTWRGLLYIYYTHPDAKVVHSMKGEGEDSNFDATNNELLRKLRDGMRSLAAIYQDRPVPVVCYKKECLMDSTSSGSIQQ